MNFSFEDGFVVLTTIIAFECLWSDCILPNSSTIVRNDDPNSFPFSRLFHKCAQSIDDFNQRRPWNPIQLHVIREPVNAQMLVRVNWAILVQNHDTRRHCWVSREVQFGVIYPAGHIWVLLTLKDHMPNTGVLFRFREHFYIWGFLHAFILFKNCLNVHHGVKILYFIIIINCFQDTREHIFY